MDLAEREEFDSVIITIIQQNVAPEVFKWLSEKAIVIKEEKGSTQLNLAFAAVPRKTGRQLIKLSAEQRKIIEKVHKGFSIDDWTIDKLCRVWLLMQVVSDDKEAYCAKIDNLFTAAEMNELAALYSALYFFNHPQEWQGRCAEGIRSNIGFVLEAIMYNNPYPFKYLKDLAWNQLVMKAFFTEKNVNRIIGLDERANKELAWILIDYANERRAAHRQINPQLWRLVAKFIDEGNFKNIEGAFNGPDEREKEGAALACFQSNYTPAKALLNGEPDLKLKIVENKLNWNMF
ncbi:EboA domain-containing protein [Segetibacter koreensis]|uniref:EboA domain-containing protein n=1 Tax=Segetibacter koreensis TaxID=398037 RepID=UPI00036A031A|nr:EboA domain-containing protein [Segetibacter koreensis]